VNADDESITEDIWALGEDLTAVVPSTKLLSWDGFLDPYFLEPPSAYLSEHGPAAFDAALAIRANIMEEKPGRLEDQNIYLRALLELGLGRNSTFFRFDDLTQTFLQNVEDVSISGVSLQAMESVIRDFVVCGSNMKKLRAFVHDTTISYKASPTRFSLASAISIVIFSLEAQLEISMPSGPSLLQLSTLFQRSGAITKCLVDLVCSTKLTETDEELISIVFKKCERLIWQHEWLTSLLSEVVLRVADPWLVFIEEWVGTRSSFGHTIDEQRHSFVKANSRDIVDDSGAQTTEVEYEMREGRMPTFVSPEHARNIFEAGKNLRLLSDLHPEHPVVTSGIDHSSSPPSLRWASSWVDLEAIQAKADQYERNLRSAILEYNRNGHVVHKPCDDHFEDPNETSEMFWWTEEEPKLPSFDPIQDLGRPLANEDGFTSDKLYTLLDSTSWCKTHCNPTNKTPFAPPFSLAPTLSLSPVLSSQSRLIDYSCLHLLFTTYDLPSHLSLQRRYHLFGDGVFTSRLSQSLFDPEMTSADRKTTSALQSGPSTGLRLGTRSTWPPAHSELRLVLMGLLNDTYFTANTSHYSPTSTSQSLPGNLSFSVRDLSEPEMEKCKNPNSIEALDFLRLQYKPPRFIETIITPLTLYKYDRIFKYLLRVLRMLAAVRALIRDVTSRSSRITHSRDTAQRFRVEAHHFISTLADYSLTTAVESAWTPFSATLTTISQAVEKGDIDSTIRHAGSMSHLQELHENTLNQIISSLFLTKSQRQVRVTLEDIFNTILSFARISHELADAATTAEPTIEAEAEVKELHAKFRKQISSFLRFLRGAAVNGTGKTRWWEKGKDRDRDAGEEKSMVTGPNVNGLERLLLRLEMSDYYAR
jgi:hypothetical protein